MDLNEAPRMAAFDPSLIGRFDHLEFPIGPDGTPEDYYVRLRDEARATGRYVFWNEKHGGFWTVLGYEEIVEISRQPDYFCNAEPTLPRYATTEQMMITSQDDPEHRFTRGLVNAPFGPGRVRVYEQMIRDNVNLLIDSFIESGEADVARLIGVPIPAIVTAMILGMPPEDGPKFSRWIAAVATGHLTDPARAAEEIAKMYAYFEKGIEDRRRDPGQDMLSYVVGAEVDGRRFTHKELLGFCTVLMVGGIDNTHRLLSTMLWRLGWDFPLRYRLIREPALIPRAIEEFLRVHSPAVTCRVVTKDITFAGCDMKAGQMIMLVHPVANRDPRVYAYPDSFIPDREQNRHLALGIGIHRCLGAHLIALEAKLVLEEFLKRLPEYKLDPVRSPKWVPGQVSGMISVPIVFAPGKAQRQVKDNPGVQAWLEAAAAPEENFH